MKQILLSKIPLVRRDNNPVPSEQPLNKGQFRLRTNQCFMNNNLNNQKLNFTSESSSDNSPREGWQNEVLTGCYSTYQRTQKYKSLPYNPKLKQRAKDLRKAGNLSEVIFWNLVKRKQFLSLDFERQKIVGNYIVDFYCPQLDLIVEIDGISHDYKGEYDLVRDKFLKELGLQIVRFEDSQIKNNLDIVMSSFYEFCKSLKLEINGSIEK